jgi:phosphatidate cytidylyltransferase
LRTRVLTGAVLAVIVFATVFGLKSPYAAIVFAVAYAIGAEEWARLVRFPVVTRVAFVASFVVAAAAFVAGWTGAAVGEWLLFAAAATWIAMLLIVLTVRRPLPRLPMTLIGLLVLLAGWYSFFRVHAIDAGGPALILIGLLIVWSADVGAFFVGRSLGRTPLAPRISPKKTWEGVVGGVVLATLTGFVSALVLGAPWMVFAPLAAAMALISVVGDLSISLLKRQAGLKDSGVLLPGHGGILDRFDGVTAALPFFVLGLQFAHVLD